MKDTVVEIRKCYGIEFDNNVEIRSFMEPRKEDV